MSLGVHCDREGCDTWQHDPTELPSGFLTVTEQGEDTHLCSVDCLLAHYAQRDPGEQWPPE